VAGAREGARRREGAGRTMVLRVSVRVQRGWEGWCGTQGSAQARGGPRPGTGLPHWAVTQPPPHPRWTQTGREVKVGGEEEEEEEDEAAGTLHCLVPRQTLDWVTELGG
jgi:hypothetical protein